MDTMLELFIHRHCETWTCNRYQLQIWLIVQQRQFHSSMLPDAKELLHSLIHRWDSSTKISVRHKQHIIRLFLYDCSRQYRMRIIWWKIMGWEYPLTASFALTSAPDLINNSATSLLLYSAASCSDVTLRHYIPKVRFISAIQLNHITASEL